MSKYDDQLNFKINENAKKAAKQKLEHGELSRRLRRVVEEIAFGEEVSKATRYEQRLRTLRERKDELRADRRVIDAEIEEVELEIARVEEQLSHLDKREDKYDAALEMLEETLYEGGRVYPDHGQVVRAAQIGDVDPEGVIEDLQERNPSIPEHAFAQGIHSSKAWDGISPEVARQ